MSVESRALTDEEIRQRMKLIYERSKLLDSIEKSIVIQLCEAGVTAGEAKRIMESIIKTTAFCLDKISLIDAMRDIYEGIKAERDGSAPLPVDTSHDVMDDLE